MASVCARSLSRCRFTTALRRSPIPSMKPTLVPPSVAAASTSAPSTARRFSNFSSRLPVELGSCMGSMYPLHSAVAAARMTTRLSSESRSCRALSQGTFCRTYPGL